MAQNKSYSGETALFAMGCFWGPDGLFGAQEGVIRTTVGYCGGTTKNPTYHKLGDHTETVKVEYDPKKIAYKELLDLFFTGHNAAAKPYSTQYKSAIFYLTDKQLKQAEKAKKEAEERLDAPVHTEFLKADAFYPAESYHQKYHLKQYPDLLREVMSRFDTEEEMAESTKAARINGYLSGHGDHEAMLKNMKRYELQPKTQQRILAIHDTIMGNGPTC